MPVLNIAFYKFVEIASPMALRPLFRKYCQENELKGTVLLSPEGINGTIAGSPEKVRGFQTWMREFPEFADLAFKESLSEKTPFQRMFVKLKKEIIPMGDPCIRPSEFTAPRIAPAELKKWLDEGKPVTLLDTRNAYEIEKGTFKNAVHFGLRTFRQFPDKLRDYQAQEPQAPVVMFCTGGIRCEKATAYALQLGLKDVFQLDGGILKYFEECGPAHYDGECFVFDERVALNGELREAQG